MTSGGGRGRLRARRAPAGRRGSTWRRATVLAVAGLALFMVTPSVFGAPQGDPRKSRGKPDVRLQPLGEEFVAWRLARAPHAATRSGARSGPPLATRVSGLAQAGDLAWLREFRERLAAVPREAPDAGRATPDAAIDRALLDAAVERELLELEVLRPFERDPGAYVTVVAGSVEAALDPSSGSVCVRLQRTARRLAEVREVLRAARLNLRNPPRVLTELAIERFEGVLRFYREDVPRRVTGCRNARLQADLAQADTSAVRAVEAFLSYLREDLLPASRGEPAIGPDACRRLLRSALVTDVAPVETLLAEGARMVETRRAELDAIAPLVAAGGARAALDSLAAEVAGDQGTLAGVRWDLGRVMEFLLGREIVSIPSRLVVNVRVAPPFRAGAGLRLSDPGVRVGPQQRPAWLEVTAPESLIAGAGGRAGANRLNRWETGLAVAHEGLPGRCLRAAAISGASSDLRKALLETWPGEDWGQYCERMMLDEGYGGEDPRYRLAGAARGLRAAGRSQAALAVHSGAMTPDQARRMLVDRCLFDDDVADREMRSVAANPALMGYSPGAQRLRELQDEARRRLGPRYRTRTFHDAVLRCGASPWGILRDCLWRELADATGDDPVGAKP